jgi:hypothetical protein
MFILILFSTGIPQKELFGNSLHILPVFTKLNSIFRIILEFSLIPILFSRCRAVERMVDFTRAPVKFFKYDLKRGKFCSLGLPFEVRAPVKITASPPSLRLSRWNSFSVPNFKKIFISITFSL